MQLIHLLLFSNSFAKNILEYYGISKWEHFKRRRVLQFVNQRYMYTRSYLHILNSQSSCKYIASGKAIQHSEKGDRVRDRRRGESCRGQNVELWRLKHDKPSFISRVVQFKVSRKGVLCNKLWNGNQIVHGKLEIS